MIRLRLTTGHYVTFDNAVDMLDFVLERMLLAGEL
ncbi:hypothetical protein PMI02_04912 [Novosphingobium sp. AP12]|nr:hypothetical protein PMI02_04912 [Novosphingobium sp. AP12]